LSSTGREAASAEGANWALRSDGGGEAGYQDANWTWVAPVAEAASGEGANWALRGDGGGDSGLRWHWRLPWKRPDGANRAGLRDQLASLCSVPMGAACCL